MSNDRAIIGGASIRAEHGNLLVLLPHNHYNVHKGWFYQAEYLVASLANNGNLDLLINTGSKSVHFSHMIMAGGQCNVYLYEEPTASLGTIVPVYDMRRDSLLTAETTVRHTPTVTATGTTALIPGRLMPGGTSTPSRIGGEARADTEWMLKPNTAYLLRVTNTSGGTIAASAAVSFYEHDEE